MKKKKLSRREYRHYARKKTLAIIHKSNQRLESLAEIAQWCAEHSKELNETECVFNWPNFAGMPKSLSNKLTSDQVDLIQSMLGGIPKSPDKIFNWFTGNGGK